MVMDSPDHRLRLDPDDGGLRRGAGRRQIDRLATQAAFADEAARPEQADDAFLALTRHDAEFDVALLDVVDRVALGALAEDVALGFDGRDGSACANRRLESFGVKVLA
jgi:hypothetical protein